MDVRGNAAQMPGQFQHPYDTMGDEAEPVRELANPLTWKLLAFLIRQKVESGTIVRHHFIHHPTYVNTPEMFHLVYVSSAVKPLSKSELAGLLAKSRENNTKLGITGLLLYKDGNFMQVLEGDEALVRELYAKISDDPLHNGAIVLLEESLDSKQFPDWSMGFHDLNDEEVRAMPGFSQFMKKPLTAKDFMDDPTGCLTLLDLFRKGR